MCSGQERRLRLHLLADPGESLLLSPGERAALRDEILRRLLQRVLILRARRNHLLGQPCLMELLATDDSRRRDAASMFTLRNSAKARRRGWITTTSASVDMNIGANAPPQRIIISWGSPDDVDDPDDGKLIEHEPGPAPSNGGPS